MPNRLIGKPPSLEGPIDIGDEVEIERIANGRVRSLLGAPELRDELMPPGRRAWFEEFIKRSVEGALLLKRREWSNKSWEMFESDFVRKGIVPAIVDILQLAHDPDGKDERRGYAYSACCTEEEFLQDRSGVREILRSAIVETDLAEWQRYPAWYGATETITYYAGLISPAERVAFRRRGAARFLPVFEPDDPLLQTLLDDDNREVRHVAAVRLAKLDPEAFDEKLLHCLLDAAADPDWIWSQADEYTCDSRGRHEAFLLLERFGARARAAKTALKEEIASIKKSFETQAYLAPWWQGWLGEAHRLLGVFEGDP